MTKLRDHERENGGTGMSRLKSARENGDQRASSAAARAARASANSSGGPRRHEHAQRRSGLRGAVPRRAQLRTAPRRGADPTLGQCAAGGCRPPHVAGHGCASLFGVVNERPATSRLRRQSIPAEPVGQATRAEQQPGSGFGDVLGGLEAVATEGHDGCPWRRGGRPQPRLLRPPASGQGGRCPPPLRTEPRTLIRGNALTCIYTYNGPIAGAGSTEGGGHCPPVHPSRG